MKKQERRRAAAAMNSRERMLAAIRHLPVDRVPTDIWATSEALAKLQAHFGAGVDLQEALHVDGMAWVGPKYAGPAMPATAEGESVNFWGERYKRVQYDDGVYEELCFHPLAAAGSIADLEAYRWPSADWFDTSEMRAAAREHRKARVVRCGYNAPFFFHNRLRGLEQSLMDPLLEPEFTHHLVGRISDFFYAYHRKLFEACEGVIDVTEVTDNLGCQTGPLISLEVYREFYKPHHERGIALAREFGIRVMHHDDGGIRPFLPDLAEIGVDILNPVQWTCPGDGIGRAEARFRKAILLPRRSGQPEDPAVRHAGRGARGGAALH